MSKGGCLPGGLQQGRSAQKLFRAPGRVPSVQCHIKLFLFRRVVIADGDPHMPFLP